MGYLHHSQWRCLPKYRCLSGFSATTSGCKYGSFDLAIGNGEELTLSLPMANFPMNLAIANSEEVHPRQTKLNHAMARGLATTGFGPCIEVVYGRLIVYFTLEEMPICNATSYDVWDFKLDKMYILIPTPPFIPCFLSLTFQQTPYLHSSTFLYFRPHSPPSPPSPNSIISSSRFPKYSLDCSLTF
ncbi:hypothetical protein L1987_25229 [Smallanthus sonchifolius]|uniref:Uncharacterized protein n=1 Tax=Smallanthus sonchifolius TaxID=185202 RepID=A0ACB9ILZ4_9ASTR|nr:hypothetical protein L1987_25229 [Smallanthus sonchifolius]